MFRDELLTRKKRRLVKGWGAHVMLYLLSISYLIGLFVVGNLSSVKSRTRCHWRIVYGVKIHLNCISSSEIRKYGEQQRDRVDHLRFSAATVIIESSPCPERPSKKSCLVQVRETTRLEKHDIPAARLKCHRQSLSSMR